MASKEESSLPPISILQFPHGQYNFYSMRITKHHSWADKNIFQLKVLRASISPWWKTIRNNVNAGKCNAKKLKQWLFTTKGEVVECQIEQKDLKRWMLWYTNHKKLKLDIWSCLPRFLIHFQDGLQRFSFIIIYFVVCLQKQFLIHCFWPKLTIQILASWLMWWMLCFLHKILANHIVPAQPALEMSSRMCIPSSACILICMCLKKKQKKQASTKLHYTQKKTLHNNRKTVILFQLQKVNVSHFVLQRQFCLFSINQFHNLLQANTKIVQLIHSRHCESWFIVNDVTAALFFHQ